MHTNNLNNEIDLKELFIILWNAKFLIAFISLLSITISILYSLSLPNIYTSNALLAPNDQDKSLSSQMTGLSQLTSIAGIGFSGGNSSKSQEAIKRIQSYEFFSTYFLPNIMLQNLVAVERWVPQNDELIYNKNLFDSSSGNWVSTTSDIKKTTPTSQDAFREYKSILKVDEDIKTGFVTLSISHKSPFISKKWVDIIVANINESMRKQEEQKAEKSISFLTESMESTSIYSIKQVTSRLLESQMQTLMAANSDDSYVFKVLDSPIAPEKKSGPSRVFICIVGTFLGLMLALLAAFLNHFRFQHDA